MSKLANLYHGHTVLGTYIQVAESVTGHWFGRKEAYYYGNKGMTKWLEREPPAASFDRDSIDLGWVTLTRETDKPNFRLPH
jgi:hypothetical protein